MRKTTRTGTVYRARSANRQQTARYVSGIGTAVLAGMLLLGIATLLVPGWLS